MRSRAIVTASLIVAVAVPAAAWTQQPKRQRPPIITRLVDCRVITAAMERLACYDREVAAVDQAVASENLMVMDRQQVRKTRTSLFGLALPNLGIFGDGEGDEEGVGRIETTIRRASENANGQWIFELEDGARWMQIDSKTMARDPRAKDKIVIRRAAMGSYLANIAGATAIRVRRIG